MEQLFNETPVVAEEVATPATSESAAEKKAAVSSLKEKLADPEYVSRLHKYTSSIECVATLGFGKSGNIVNAGDKENRKLVPTSKIVGYEFINNGKEPIAYECEVWEKDGEGKYVAKAVKKTWKPGETIQLTRKSMAMLFSIPEISCEVANGKIIGSSKKNVSLSEALGNYHFRFSDGTRSNDDEVKKAIDVDGVVKPEYIETFGFLMNPKATKAGTKRGGRHITSQDLTASRIQDMIKNAQQTL